MNEHLIGNETWTAAMAAMAGGALYAGIFFLLLLCVLDAIGVPL